MQKLTLRSVYAMMAYRRITGIAPPTRALFRVSPQYGGFQGRGGSAHLLVTDWMYLSTLKQLLDLRTA
jgi:hypothetical protein